MSTNRIIIFFFTIILYSYMCYGNEQTSSRIKNILVLQSYNSGLSWTDNINKGIFDSFKNEKHRTVDLRIEYLDAKHSEESKDFKTYLQQKYKDIKLDVIISADNPAFDFLSLHHNELFKQTPIVFCGLNYCDSIPNGFTGVMEDVDLENNIKNILKIHPNYKKLYIINDNSITGKSINKELSKVIQNKLPNLNYEILTNYTLDELNAKLNTLGKDHIVLMVLFNFDRLGKAISYDIILEEIIPFCHVPMYGMWDFYLGKGIVGGIVSNSYDHGIEASKMAKEILNGKDINSIPIISGPLRTVYDYQILEKFNIDKELLPSNASLINSPYELIQKNQHFFYLLAAIFTLLFALIFVLIYLNRRAKKNLSFERATAEIIKEKSEALATALEKVECANKLKTAFLCNLSHEIRTPMNGIVGFTSIMKNDDDINNHNEYIDLINDNATTLLNVINDIVEISKIESQLVQIHKSEVSINDILTQCVTEFNKKASEKDIFISLRLSLPKQEAIIQTDGNKISNTISHLLSNAIKFSDGGNIALGYTKEQTHYLFFCKDEGIGIDQNYIETIFEPFRKVELSTHKLYGGNGLGLAISKAHIELLGGKIWVNSTPYKGSTFYFTLPIKH